MRMIDIHMHPWTRDFVIRNKPIVDACSFFRIKEEELPKSIQQLIDEMDKVGVEKGVILGQDFTNPSNKDFANYRLTNSWLKEISENYDKKLIPFAGVDPNSTDKAKKELKKCFKEYGFRGLKIHSSVHAVYPNDKKKMYPLYEICQEYSSCVLFHTGTTGLGGCKIIYSKPEYLDEVCQDFPDLKIVMAHFGWPWSDVAIAIALRNKNAYIDISGWLPRYIPENVISYMNSILSDKFLFGTDYPMIRHERWLTDFNDSISKKLKDDVKEKLLYLNAKKLLSL